MKLLGAYHIPAPPDRVFECLTDPAMVQRCLEGCTSMVEKGEGIYDVHMKLGLAGIKGNYTGKVTMKDQNPPKSYTLIVEGKGAPGFVKGTAHVQLVEKSGETELQCDSEAHVGGMIAAIGSRLVEAAARKMMGEFFRKFAEEMKAK